MIRWRFVLTRLIVLIAILMLLRWGLGPVAQYVTIRGMQQATGAKVDIASTQIGLFPPSIRYTDVDIADPRGGKEMRNAFHADTIDFVIDGDALLHRRWVANDGRMTGIQIGSRRDASGHFDQVDEIDQPDSGPSMLSRLLRGAANQVAGKADELVSDLETVRTSRQIRDHWESEYDRLLQRAKQLESQISEIRDSAKGIENPLRDWPEFERALAKAQRVRTELVEVRQAIDGLPKQVQADMDALEKARQRDLAKVDQYVPGDLSQSDNFGIDVMTTAVQSQIQRLKDYLDHGRTLANYTIVAPDSERQRGVDFDLEPHQSPHALVRRCEIGGVLRADGNVYELTGILENLSPTPQWLAEPTRARLRLEGPEVMRVEYVRDRRNNNDTDLLTVHWPQTEAKPLRLGNDSDVGITAEGGQRELWVQIESSGDQISGRLVSKQTGVTMGLQVAPQFAASAAAVSLQESLAAVDRIEIDGKFQGTWKDLDLALSSNVGPVLQRACQQAISHQIVETKQRLRAKVDQAYQEQSIALQQWLAEHQSEAHSMLASTDETVEKIREKMLEQWGNADTYLGRLRGAMQGRLR